MIFIDETDRWHGMNLATVLVDRLRKEGCAGATVLRGSVGFGVHGQIYTTAIVDLSVKLPVVIIAVDDIEIIDRVLPVVQEMVSEGLILVDEVDAIRKNGKSDQRKETKSTSIAEKHHLVAEYMDVSPVTINADKKLDEIVRMLVRHQLADLPVVNENQVVLGVVSSHELLRRIVQLPEGPSRFFSALGLDAHEDREDLKSLTAADVMRTQFVAVEPDTPMVKAIQIMMHDKLFALPVMSDHKLKGILRLPDVLQKALAAGLSDAEERAPE